MKTLFLFLSLFIGCTAIDLDKTVAVEWTISHYFSDDNIQIEKVIKQELLSDVLKRIENDSPLVNDLAYTYEEDGKYYASVDVAEGFYMFDIK